LENGAGGGFVVSEKFVFKRWTNVPDLAAATEEAEKLAEKYLKSADSTKAEEKAQARKLWQQLSDKYWDVLFALVDAQTESFPDVLTFDDEERLFIDFGFISDRITPRNKKFDPKTALSAKAVSGVFQYETFTDFIAECWGMITDRPAPTALCGFSPEDRLKDLQDGLQEFQEKRNLELAKILSGRHGLSESELNELTEDLGRLIPATKVMLRTKEFREAPSDYKQALSQERFRYSEAERVMDIQFSIAQKDEEEPLGLPELEEFQALHESTKVMARKIIYAQQEEEKARKRAKRVSAACAQFSQQMMRKELKNVLAKKKDYMAVPAKVARCEQSLLSPQDSEPLSYETASRMLEKMAGMDMDMFTVPRIRMYGVPRVIFVPGQGWGTYDWADHTLLLPVFPVTSAEKAVAYGLGTFRWDSDEDRLLKNTYETIKHNKGKSILEMASSFYKDYFLWMTKEKEGYRILPRETHKTFLHMFAPRGTGE
jgi:hypothetical protein